MNRKAFHDKYTSLSKRATLQTCLERDNTSYSVCQYLSKNVGFFTSDIMLNMSKWIWLTKTCVFHKILVICLDYFRPHYLDRESANDRYFHVVIDGNITRAISGNSCIDCSKSTSEIMSITGGSMIFISEANIHSSKYMYHIYIYIRINTL